MQTTDQRTVVYDVSPLTRDDLYLFNEGNHFRLYDRLGARLMTDVGRLVPVLPVPLVAAVWRALRAPT